MKNAALYAALYVTQNLHKVRSWLIIHDDKFFLFVIKCHIPSIYL